MRTDGTTAPTLWMRTGAGGMTTAGPGGMTGRMVWWSEVIEGGRWALVILGRTTGLPVRVAAPFDTCDEVARHAAECGLARGRWLVVPLVELGRLVVL